MAHSHLVVAEKKINGVSAGFVVGFENGGRVISVRKDLVFKTEKAARKVFDSIEENSKEETCSVFEVKETGQSKYYSKGFRW